MTGREALPIGNKNNATNGGCRGWCFSAGPSNNASLAPLKTINTSWFLKFQIVSLLCYFTTTITFYENQFCDFHGNRQNRDKTIVIGFFFCIRLWNTSELMCLRSAREFPYSRGPRPYRQIITEIKSDYISRETPFRLFYGFPFENRRSVRRRRSITLYNTSSYYSVCARGEFVPTWRGQRTQVCGGILICIMFVYIYRLRRRRCWSARAHHAHVYKSRPLPNRAAAAAAAAEVARRVARAFAAAV